MKRLIFSLAVIGVSANSMAAAVIDSSDLGDGDWRTVALSVGFLASLACHEHKKLIRFGKVTETVEVICRWVFRIAIFLVLISLLGRTTGWLPNMDADVGWGVFWLWSLLRAAQALYVSGVNYGMRESSYIFKQINEARVLD